MRVVLVRSDAPSSFRSLYGAAAGWLRKQHWPMSGVCHLGGNSDRPLEKSSARGGKPLLRGTDGGGGAGVLFSVEVTAAGRRRGEAGLVLRVSWLVRD